MSTPADDDRRALARSSRRDAPGWRGDEHHLVAQAAGEAGLAKTDVELDLFTQGFTSGITLDDPFDHAIVSRGRTVLKDHELRRSLRATMRFLGVNMELVKLSVHDGNFELRIDKRATEGSNPALDAAKLAIHVWLGFGLLGLVAYNVVAPVSAAIIWGLGLVVGGWQLRRGLTSARAMIGARLAMALGMLAQEEKLILPPAGGER